MITSEHLPSCFSRVVDKLVSFPGCNIFHCNEAPPSQRYSSTLFLQIPGCGYVTKVTGHRENGQTPPLMDGAACILSSDFASLARIQSQSVGCACLNFFSTPRINDAVC